MPSWFPGLVDLIMQWLNWQIAGVISMKQILLIGVSFEAVILLYKYTAEKLGY